MLLFDIEYDDHFQEKGCIGLNHNILYSVHSVVWEVQGLMILWFGRSGGCLVM